VPAERRVLLNPPGRRLGERNAIMTGLRAPSRREIPMVDDFPGPLSIKTVFVGAGLWRAAGATFRVEPGSFLVLNDGQTYSLALTAGEPHETFCPMFARGFVDDVRRARAESDERLLDDPQGSPAPAEFVEHLRPGDVAVGRRLRRMRDRLRAGRANDAWLEEQFHALAADLLDAEGIARAAADGLPALRPGTRAEILRRLHRARDFLHAHYAEPLAIPAIARVACLSPHHFLRLFRAAFGVTPHRYLVRLRLERAKSLLCAGRSVTGACLEVGFESPGSFSTLFRREVGVSPAAFRGSPHVRTAAHR
jgi:AraC-like DNA-binding protein